MRIPRHPSRPGRAIVAVAALYALVLHAMLGAMVGVPGARVAAWDPHQVCAPATSDGDEAPRPHEHDGASCCCLVSGVALPAAPTTFRGIAYRARGEAAGVPSRADRLPPPTGPPDARPPARAPPHRA